MAADPDWSSRPLVGSERQAYLLIMNEEITQADLHTATESFYSALTQVLGGNPAPMLGLWSHSDDVCYMGPMGQLLVGPDPIRASWQEQADSDLGGTVTPTDLHFVACGAIGIVTGWERGAGHRGIPETVNIRATSTYRRENGFIKMIGHHTDLIAI